MLVLTRKAQESVVVGTPGTAQPLLTVTVLAIEGSRVRLGFQGDPAVPVHREEVWQRIQAVEPPGGLTPDPVPAGTG
jgi:carbon storage regulator